MLDAAGGAEFPPAVVADAPVHGQPVAPVAQPLAALGGARGRYLDEAVGGLRQDHDGAGGLGSLEGAHRLGAGLLHLAADVGGGEDGAATLPAQHLLGAHAQRLARAAGAEAREDERGLQGVAAQCVEDAQGLVEGVDAL